MSQMEWMIYVGSIIIIFLIILYAISPCVFYYCKRLRNFCLFANFLNFPHPLLYPLKNPEYFGINNGTNHTLSIGLEDCINLWSIESSKDNERKIVILYCHGNSSNRAQSNRISLYRVLSENGYHIVTFDYRGYGDSSGCSPNENSVVGDAEQVLEWTKEHFPGYQIIIWGHSLGTGISIKLLADLDDCVIPIKGLVLESPFLNSGEAGRYFPLMKYFKILPYSKHLIGGALDGMFPSDDLIAKVAVPIIILHATDDNIIPVHNGVQLEEACRSNGKADIRITVVNLGGHKFLFRNKTAMDAAVHFIDEICGLVNTN